MQNQQYVPLIYMCVSLFYSSSPQTQAGEGKVYKCLFNHKFEEAMSEKVQPTKHVPPGARQQDSHWSMNSQTLFCFGSCYTKFIWLLILTTFSPPSAPKCRDALTTRQKLISQDYRVSYSLAKACKLDLRKQRCSLDANLPRAREARLSYLLLCLEAAVHRGEWRGVRCDLHH